MPGEKSPLLALILSFILAGLGQIYNGEIVKGIVFLVVFFVLIVLAVLTLVFFVGLIPFWAYGLYDAYTRAQMYNQTLRTTGRPPW